MDDDVVVGAVVEVVEDDVVDVDVDVDVDVVVDVDVDVVEVVGGVVSVSCAVLLWPSPLAVMVSVSGVSDDVIWDV